MTENFPNTIFDVTNIDLIKFQTAFAEKNLNDLKYEMLEKQVGLLNGELKALKTVNDMLKEGFSNWCQLDHDLSQSERDWKAKASV